MGRGGLVEVGRSLGLMAGAVATGAAVAVLMDSGGLEWGDAEGAKRILREIAEGTDLGKAIGNGALATGKRQKHARVPTVRGQAIPAWDPRPLKATSETFPESSTASIMVMRSPQSGLWPSWTASGASSVPKLWGSR